MRRIGLLFLLAAALCAADFRAGVARVDVTPEGPIWMSGYASRKHPSEGVLKPLYVRALAIEDSRGYRQVIVGLDLIGIPRTMADEVCARAAKQYDLDRPQVLLNASHTHTGPVVWPNLSTMYGLDDELQARLERYSRRVTEAIVTAIGAALGDLAPATLAFGQGEAGFAINRREFRKNGKIDFGVNPKGPVDHSMPMVRVLAPDGKLRAILFGYACHNTTLTGQHYRISGDYAGYAEEALEKEHPGTVAVFLQLCGADQNPYPRGEIENAVAHGAELTGAVLGVLKGKLVPIDGPIRSVFQLVDLEFRYHTREQFEAELDSDNPSQVRRAKKMLAAYDARHPIRSIAYPVQVVRFGDSLTVLALGGEVVIDYALRAKREFPHERLVVAGYSNDVMCYIPSLRILRESGYEADSSMIYYGQPGPFADDVEERVFKAIHQAMERAGAGR